MNPLRLVAARLVTAGVVVLALWTSAAPAMSYPLYIQAWGLTETNTTVVFAVYPIILVTVLLVFGDVSDHIGRRNSILIGLGAELVGVLLFALARDIWWLYIGRAFMGIGVGFSLSPASAAIVELAPEHHKRHAGAITTAASAAGITIAMLLGGFLVQYAPHPMRLDFIVLAAVVAIMIAGTFTIPRHVGEDGNAWRVKLPTVPAGIRRSFLVAAAALVGSYVLGSLVLSLGSGIAKELAGSDNAFTTGAMLSLFGIFIGLSSIAFSRATPLFTVAIGAIASTAGVWLFLLSGNQHSLILFLTACIVSGVGYSLNFLGGVSLISMSAPHSHRAGMFSFGYLVAYLFQGAGAVSLGMLATHSGLRFALGTAAVVLSAFCLLTLLLTWLVAKSLSAQPSPTTTAGYAGSSPVHPSTEERGGPRRLLRPTTTPSECCRGTILAANENPQPTSL